MLRCIPLATVAMLALIVLATGTVSAGRRQQTAVDICGRTQEVQDAILNETGGTCSAVTDTQLAGIQYFYIDGYSSATVVPSDRPSVRPIPQDVRRC